MAKWEGKTRGGLTGYKIFVFYIKTFGIGFSYVWVYLVAWYFIFFSRDAYKAIFFYFNKIHKYNKIKSFFSTFANFVMLGKTLVDKIAVLSGMKKKYTFDFEGEHYLRQMVSDGKGGMLINAHIGNWEIAGQLLERLNTTIHVLMFDAEHQQISRFMDKVLTEKSINIIVIKEDMSHLHEIQDALSRKEIIAMSGDRFIDGGKTYTMNFLGKPAVFPAGPFSIASKFDVPVTFAFAMKETKSHYHFFATPPKKIGHYKNLAEREIVLKQMVEEYVTELTEKVKLYPLQWFNYYQYWSN